MKIEVILCNDIEEKGRGMTSFNTSPYIREVVRDQQAIEGIVIIDGEAVKFRYYTLGDDGDIFTNNDTHREIVRAVVPLQVFKRFNVVEPL